MTPTHRTSLLLACALVVGSAAVTRVSAQASAADKAAAQALFDQALAHMREGKLAQACGELERSQALERGIGTMLYLAECYEKTGRTASAWALFREAASVAAAQGETERSQAGAARADRLEPGLSRLTLQVAPENRVEGFTLTRNGHPVREPSWATAVPVDPGEHVLAASAPGRLSWTQTVTVHGNAERVELQVPALAVDPNAVAQPAPPPEPAPSPAPVSVDAAATADAPPAESGWPLQRTIALVAGGVGVVGLGVGGYFGLRAFDKNSDAEEACGADPDNCKVRDGETLTEDAKEAATLSTAFMIGGGVLLAAGVVLFVTAPDSEAPEVALRVAPGAVRLTVGGAL